MLREPEARDRRAFIELLASPEVGTYLGGPQPRDELEHGGAALMFWGISADDLASANGLSAVKPSSTPLAN